MLHSSFSIFSSTSGCSISFSCSQHIPSSSLSPLPWWPSPAPSCLPLSLDLCHSPHLDPNNCVSRRFLRCPLPRFSSSLSFLLPSVCEPPLRSVARSLSQITANRSQSQPFPANRSQSQPIAVNLSQSQPIAAACNLLAASPSLLAVHRSLLAVTCSLFAAFTRSPFDVGACSTLHNSSLHNRCLSGGGVMASIYAMPFSLIVLIVLLELA
jgi:hypothetical protein